jgi:hypothetical protein
MSSNRPSFRDVVNHAYFDSKTPHPSHSNGSLLTRSPRQHILEGYDVIKTVGVLVHHVGMTVSVFDSSYVKKDNFNESAEPIFSKLDELSHVHDMTKSSLHAALRKLVALLETYAAQFHQQGEGLEEFLSHVIDDVKECRRTVDTICKDWPHSQTIQ